MAAKYLKVNLDTGLIRPFVIVEGLSKSHCAEGFNKFLGITNCGDLPDYLHVSTTIKEAYPGATPVLVENHPLPDIEVCGVNYGMTWLSSEFAHSCRGKTVYVTAIYKGAVPK